MFDIVDVSAPPPPDQLCILSAKQVAISMILPVSIILLLRSLLSLFILAKFYIIFIILVTRQGEELTSFKKFLRREGGEGITTQCFNLLGIKI